MADPFSPAEVSTNGSHTVKGGSPPPDDVAERSLISRSVEERLGALRERVRTWNWHEVSVDAPPTGPGAAVANGPAPVGAAAAPAPGPFQAPADVVDPPVAPATGRQPDDATTMVPSGEVLALESVPAVVPEDDSPFEVSGPGSAARREGGRASHRARPNNRVKVAVAIVLAILAVGGIVEGIRLVTANSNGSPGDATTQTTATPHHGPVQAPIDAAKLTRYEGYAVGLQKANETATRGFVAAGSTPSAAQVAGIVTTYRTALNLYDFQLHFIAWPTSMATAIATDHAQFHALLSFLQSFSSIAPTGVSAWLTQLHDRTGSTAAADNVVRNDLGLSNSSAWP